MTTYNTYHSYEEAKISNPENDIYTIDDVFFAVNLRNSARCKPEEECMTVEHFLNEGLIFTEGDLILDCGTVFCVTKTPPLIGNCFTVDSSNTIDICDNERYILRAAALEEPEPELTKDDSPQGVISAISNRLHNMGCEHQDSELGEELGSMACDIWGVLPLISNEPIEEKKPRTKVEYVKVTDSIFDLQSDFEAGELFSKVNHARDYSAINNTQTLAQALHQVCCYRRIETPMTWQDELYDYLDNSCEMNDNFDDSFTIEIDDRPLSFNLSDDELVDMCKFVASLNSVS